MRRRSLNSAVAGGFLLLALGNGSALAQGGSNLLLNPSFEETGEGNGPSHWRSDCSGESRAGRDNTMAHTGSACGHLVKATAGPSHVSALVFPRVDVEGGAEYTLSGWGKSQVPEGQANLFLYQYDRENNWLGNYFVCSLPARTDRWTPLRTTDKVRPDCAWVQVRFEIYGGASHGEAWIDDVYFGSDTTPPPPVRRLQAAGRGETVHLSWMPPAGEVPWGYLIFRAPYPHFTPAQDAVIGFTTGSVFSELVRPGQACYYAAVAVDRALNFSEAAFAGPIRLPGIRGLPERVVWTAGPAKRWGPDLPWPLPRSKLQASLEMARGEWESVQVLVGAPRAKLPQATVNLKGLQGPGSCGKPHLDFEIYLQEYVQLAGSSRWLPDPLPPNGSADIAPGMLRGWWILVHAPPEAPPGHHRARLQVATEGLRPLEVVLKIRVWPVTVPFGNHYGGSWGIWGQQLAEQQQVPLNSEEFQQLYRRYWEFFLEHRMIPRGLTGDLGSEEAARWLQDERVASFVIPTGAWAQRLNEEQLACFKALCQRLRGKGWLEKGYVYIYDEPAPENYPVVVELCQQVREAGRDVPILLTEQPEEALYGWVDIWCPLLNLYAEAQERCRERQRQGERVWWYVCLAPPPPWPNYLLTNDPIDARVLSWLQVKYGVQGELYWAVTCFPGNVWEHGLPANWPGDGYLCYPGKPRGLKGPVTCIRAEAIRDGKEDLELIWLLRHRAAKQGQAERAEQVIGWALGQVCRNFTEYTKRDEDLTAARKVIFEEMVRLEGRDSGGRP